MKRLLPRFLLVFTRSRKHKTGHPRGNSTRMRLNAISLNEKINCHRGCPETCSAMKAYRQYRLAIRSCLSITGRANNWLQAP